VVDWATRGGPSILLTREVFQLRVVEPEVIAPITTAAVEAGAFAEVLCTDDRARTGRHAGFDGAASTLAQVLDEAMPWVERIDHLREVLLALPDRLDHAAVRPATVGGAGWDGLDFRQRLPPPLRERDVQGHLHLLDRYAYDAHGVQVLTDAHLAKAHDLTRWSVTDLGHGRHLVEAPDLAPWYAAPLPEPTVVEQARHDFGAMLLTLEAIRAEAADEPT
jgi:hypothetical protein